MSRFLEKQEWTPSLNKNQLREKLRRNLIDSSMLKYGLDNFVDGAISSKKRGFDPQIRKIVQELLGTTDNDEDNSNLSNGLAGREYSSYDNRYNSYHHSYGRSDRGERNDRDHYYSSHSRRSDYDSNSQMEYDVDNTEQDMEVDDDSGSSGSSRSPQVKAENEIDSSVQARLDSFLQTFKEVSKQQQQRKQIQSRQESVTNSAESGSSSDSTDVLSKLTAGAQTSKPLSLKPTFKFNLNLVKNEPGTSSDTSNAIQPNSSNRLDGNCDESKDDFSTQDMKLEEVSPNSDLTPGDSNEETESKLTECTKGSALDANVNITHEPSSSLQGKPMPLNAPVTLPPAHLLADPQIPMEDEFDDDELSNSPKAPTPEPISPGPIDVNFEEEETSPPSSSTLASVKPGQPTLVTGENVLTENPPREMPISQVTRIEQSCSNDSQDVKEEIVTQIAKETTIPEASKGNSCSNIPQNIKDAALSTNTLGVGSSNKISPDVTKVKCESEITSPQISTNQVKKEPKNTQENQVTGKSCQSQAQLSQKVTSNTSKNRGIVVKKEPIVLTVPTVPLEDILSDVSSVHTSDLSDFDDRISISSSEEMSLYAVSGEQETLSLSVTLNSTAAPTASTSTSGRRKISLQEVKQQLRAGERVTSASSSAASSGGSTSQGVKGKGKRSNFVNAAAPAPAEVNKQQNVAAKGRRERKINPKYASDEYSSIYNRKKGSGISHGLMEEEIDSDEDFDQQSIEDNASKETVNSPSISVDTGETSGKDLEEKESEAATVAEEDEETSNSITSPIDCQSDTSTSAVAATGAIVKKMRKKVQQRQVRYEASDLYKPRPSIGSSRRRNVNNES